MKTVAYLRISTGSQDLANQKLAVLDYARQNRFAIDRFVEAQASSRKGLDQRRIEELLGELAVGDRLVVSELSRLGRSLSQVIQLVDDLVKRKVRFIAIKEAIRFEGGQDMQTKVMVALFGLFAEVERDLISERTREGLAAARAKGRLLGRPKGSLGSSKLDGKDRASAYK
jgi:DNA invertase Pin-like site-specific DNA recombinase